MTQDYFKAETTKRYDIPLAHLDYSYIRGCSDVKELEKILRVLRSGDEGHYPELENEAEKRLQELNPKSRVLRKDSPALRPSDLDRTEQEDLKNDLETWQSTMADKEETRSAGTISKRVGEDDFVFDEDTSLPPVRSGKVISADGKVKEPTVKTGNSRVMPRSYKEWDKLNIDEELGKVEKDSTQPKNDTKPSTFTPDGITTHVDTLGMSDDEKRRRAVREKDKGNEAFHAHDFEESIMYYTRSISIAPLAATFNNRALAYLRISKWTEAIKDCNHVLKLEPKNIKALLRRGTALKGKKDYPAAKSDLDAVLVMESNNKTAQDLLAEISKEEKKAAKEIEERKQKGRRMVIEEVDGSEEEGEDEDVTEEIIVEKPDSAKTSPLLVNGHENTVASASTEPDGQEPPSKERELSSGNAEPVEAACLSEEKNEDSASAIPRAMEDICSEKDTNTAQSEEMNSSPRASTKPKLVATSILSEQSKALINCSKPAGNEEKDTVAAASGTGDTAQADVNCPTTSSRETGDTVAEDSVENACEEIESQSNGPCSTEQTEEEAETVHSRPVFVQMVFPPAEAALREKGNSLFRAGQYPDAIDTYGKIIKKLETAPGQEVNLSLIYSNRAACYLKIGDCQSAIEDCGTSLSLVPHSVKPLLRRAGAFETLERYGQAYVDYKHVLSVDSSIEHAYQGVTRCQGYLRNQYGAQWRDKLPLLVRVSQWDIPEIVDESSGGDQVPTTVPPKEAAHRVPVIEEKPPVSAAPSPPEEKKAVTEGVADTKQKKTGTQDVPTKKVPSPEELFETTKAKGNKHVQKGEYKAAAECYCQCVKLFADRAAIFTNRALCYLKLNKAHEAEDDCTTALALEPANCKAYYRRALARKAKKHYKDSLQDLLQLLRLEPANTAAKKEMELVKGLYKQEYDQLKAQPTSDKKKVPEPEKKRKRMKIEEVDEDSDSEEKPSQAHQASTPKAKSSGSSQKMPSTASPSPQPVHTQKPSSTPSQAQPSPASDKHSNTRASESRKPGRGKSKKGSIKETSVGLPVTPPSAPKLQGKITPFEFLQHWNSLKQAKEIQPYVQLLEQISPDDLPGVISNKLDGHMLQIIARCAAHDAQTGEVDRAYRILRNIRQVPRFSTVVMFLSNKEKQDIRKVLESPTILGAHSAEEVLSVRKDYGLK